MWLDGLGDVWAVFGWKDFFLCFFWSVFPRHYFLLTLLPISISPPPSTLVLRPCNVLSGRLTCLLFSPFLRCCCLYILRLLSSLCLLSLLLSTFLRCPTSLRLHSFDKLPQLLILFNHLSNTFQLPPPP